MSQDPRYGSDPTQAGLLDDDSAMERQRRSDKSDMMDKAKESASRAAGEAKDRAEAQKDRAAGGLEHTADTIRDQLDDKGGAARKVGGKMADSLERSAGYLREHETDEMWDDLEAFVKEHPIQAAVTAAVAGFVVARMIR